MTCVVRTAGYRVYGLLLRMLTLPSCTVSLGSERVARKATQSEEGLIAWAGRLWHTRRETPGICRGALCEGMAW